MNITGAGGERWVTEPLPLQAAQAPSPPSVAAPEGTFAQALRGLGRKIDVGEAQVAAASQLHNYDTATLIALQAGIYRYSEAVDLASKIVDRAANAVRTVLQGSGH